MKRTFVILSGALAALAVSAAILGMANGRKPATRVATVSRSAANVHMPPIGVAADVNGQTIPLSQISETALRLQGASILDQLIGDTLIHQEALRRNAAATPEEIDARIEQIRAMVRPKSLDDSLRARHVSMTDFRDDMRSGIEVRRLVADRLRPVPMVHIRDIFINIAPDAAASAQRHTAAQANRIMAAILRKLKAGIPFETLTRQFSDDNLIGKDGSDLGIVAGDPGADSNRLAQGFSAQPEFLKACLSLGKGQIAGPIKTRFGLHLIQAVSTAADPEPSDAALYAAARDQAADNQIARLAPQCVEVLKHTGKVTVYLGKTTPALPGVAATVNGEDIPLSHVTDIAVATVGPMVAERMIGDLLVHQEAAKRRVVIGPEQIDAAIEEILRQAKPRTLDDILNRTHMTLSEFRETQRARLSMETMVGDDIGEIRAAHIRDIDIMIKRDAKAKAGHTEAEARAILAAAAARLKAGEKFDAVARRFSEDLGSRARGGDLGIVTGKDAFEPAFLRAAMALKPGQVTGQPVRTAFDLHLLQAVSTSDGHPAAEDATYRQILKAAKQREIQKQIPAFASRLRSQGRVVDFLARTN